MHNSKGMNYKVFGSGRAVVFLHGFLESISMWEYLALHELNRTCILFDIPGHGKSELTDGL
jgi:pimeloyl-ACP methyl ester carboxylesterase